MNLLQFFWIFLKASLFSFGGMGNLPFLHKDLIQLGWAKESDFITAIAVGQLSPGPSGLWSISLGFLVLGWPGVVLSFIALLLPTFLILLVGMFYSRIEHLDVVKFFTRGLMLGVVGLTLGAMWGLARAAVTGWVNLLIALVAMALALTEKIPVIVILGLAAAAGLLLYGM